MTDKPRRHSASHINMRDENTPRLTLIAPKAERGLHSGQISPGIRRPRSASGIYKEKLPPRSRTGCWTCRTRKVKCDEEHPRCGQCARLQHECDYSPRLSFRDDTPRIIERMQEVSTTGSVVWDASARSRNGSIFRNSLDLSLELQRDPQTLPPFSELTNDEERELKALTRLPGTYHLVCNPSSFTAIDEGPDGSEEGSEGPTRIPIKRESLDNMKLENATDDSPLERNLARTSLDELHVDPDVVILRRFEEPPTKLVLSASVQTKASTMIPESEMFSVDYDITKDEIKLSVLPLDDATTLPNDTRYYQYYKEFIIPQLIDIRGFGNIWGLDLQQGDSFEREALEFPPLYHAMMALAAFSMNQREGNANLDSLQYYQLALPALQSSLATAIDLMSDGILFTHFFLLLYEIAAFEIGTESLWQQHLLHIKSIVLSRQTPPTNDANLFVIWYIFALEVYTSLSAGREGDLAEALLKSNLVPDGVSLFNANWTDEKLTGLLYSSAFVDNEVETYRQLLSLNRMLLITGNAVAKTSQAVKTAFSSTDYVFTDGNAISLEQIDLSWRQSRMLQNIEEIQTVWLFHRRHLGDLELDNMEFASPRVKMMYAQAALFYQMCLLYTYTSMWPGQRTYLDSDTTMEIEAAIKTIIRDSHTISNEKKMYQNLGFMAFPLFLAGTMSSSATEKMWIFELLGSIEGYSIGRNITALREALQVVYQHQNDAMMTVGHSLNVEWQDILGDLGVHVVTFGI